MAIAKSVDAKTSHAVHDEAGISALAEDDSKVDSDARSES